MSEMLSQEEINSLLNSAGGGNDTDTQDTAPEETIPEETTAAENEKLDIRDVLTDIEVDALGEIGNISMGSAATALSNLLNRRVDITTPVVTLTNSAELSQKYERPCVSVNVPYVEGLHGDNVLVIKMDDVKAITTLLIGSDEYSGSDVEINEIHLSAISEVMNQMMGASATALSQLMQMRINIAPPAAEVMDFSERFASNTNIVEDSNDMLVASTFKMDVEDLFVTDIVLLMKSDFSKNIVSSFFASNGVIIDTGSQGEHYVEGEASSAQASAPVSAPAPEPAASNAAAPTASAAPTAAPPPAAAAPAADPYAQGGYPPPYPYPPYPYPPYPMGGAPAAAPAAAPAPAVNVQSVQFENFAQTPVSVPTENIGMLMDVPLQVSVELGKSKKTLKDILELNIGSIITLDKTSGEMVDVIINGKMVAKGEVVVVDDNFAVRITEIFNNLNKVL